MTALLPLYLLLAVLHISGTFGSPSFVHEVISQRSKWENPFPKTEWDNEVLQNIRRSYKVDRQRFLMSKFYDRMKYHQSHFPGSGTIQKQKGSAQVQSMTIKAFTVPVAKYGSREGLPKAISTKDISLDPITRFEANEIGEHSTGLQQTVDVAQQDSERDPTEITRETLDVEENSTIIESTEKSGHTDSIDSSESGASREEVKKETDDIISTEENGITETVTDSSRSEEATTPSIHDMVDETTNSAFGGTSEGISHSKTHSSTTTGTVTKPASSIHFTADSKHLTADGRSSEEISPSTANFPATTITVSETISSILSTTDSKHSTTDGSSSNGISSSTTHFPATTVTLEENFSFTFSTADSKHSTVVDSSSTVISPLTNHFPATTVTVSPTPSKGTEATPEHVINMPRIRTAKIVISSVLLAIGLVAVAVMAVCIFRERRKAVKYDQLKLLP